MSRTLSMLIAERMMRRINRTSFEDAPRQAQAEYHQLAKDILAMCQRNAQWTADRARYPFRIWFHASAHRLMLDPAWLDDPHEYLDGMSPREALEAGEIGTDNLALELRLIRALVDAGRKVGA